MSDSDEGETLPATFEECKKLKEEATEKFKAQEFEEAAKLYVKGAQGAQGLDDKGDEQNKYIQVCWQNAAICNNKLGGVANFTNAVQFCTNALEIDEKSEKALVNRATANMGLKEFTAAHADCKAAILINPNNKAYREMLEKINTGKKAEAAKNKNAFGGLFSGGGMYDEKEDFVPRPDTDNLPAFDPENAQCFFDMTIGGGEK